MAHPEVRSTPLDVRTQVPDGLVARWTFPALQQCQCQRRVWSCWALPLKGRERRVVQTQFNERLGQFSPDGKWIAYQSDETGRYQVYVQPFPGLGGDVALSTDGGTQVRWNPHGTELFYVSA